MQIGKGGRMKYRKKSEIVEAIKYTLDNSKDVFDFAKGKIRHDLLPGSTDLRIKTSGGTLTLTVGNYIIKDEKGEFYQYPSDVFEYMYEVVE